MNFHVAHLHRMRLTSQDTGSPSSACASTPKFVRSKAGVCVAAPHCAATCHRPGDVVPVDQLLSRDASGVPLSAREDTCALFAHPRCIHCSVARPL